MHDWQRGREEMERDIRADLRRAGCNERDSADFARRRANDAMERAANIAIEEGTDRPQEI